MCSARVADDHPQLRMTFLTSERAPLQVFGELASLRVSKLIEERGIELVCSAHCEIPREGEILIDSHPRTAGSERSGHGARSRRISAELIVSLPELFGPHVRGYGLPLIATQVVPDVDRAVDLAHELGVPGTEGGGRRAAAQERRGWGGTRPGRRRRCACRRRRHRGVGQPGRSPAGRAGGPADGRAESS